MATDTKVVRTQCDKAYLYMWLIDFVTHLSASGSARLGVISEHGQRSFLVHQILVRPVTQTQAVFFFVYRTVPAALPLQQPASLTHLEKGSLRLGGENMVLEGFSTMFTITVWAELFF